MATLAGRGAGASATLGRSRLFFWLVMLAALNAFAGIAIRIVPERGLTYAIFELFGISAIVWLALAAALALLLPNSDERTPSRLDLAVAAATVAVALLPVATASAVMLTGLSLYIVLTSPAGSPGRKAGLIGLAITATLIWGRLALALFSRPLLDADTWLVALLTGADQAGNTLAFLDGSGGLAVAPGCSSWQGMSLALLFWVTVNQWFGVKPGLRSLGWLGAALAATIGINVLRIAAMVRFPDHIAAIHHGYGWHLSMWATLIAVAALCIYGARREIFDS
jgi:exosortase/archaeosortase family protein